MSISSGQSLAILDFPLSAKFVYEIREIDLAIAVEVRSIASLVELVPVLALSLLSELEEYEAALAPGAGPVVTVLMT